MKMDTLLPIETLTRLPLSFQYFQPIDKTMGLFINRYIGIKRYQSHRCAVQPPLKPVSKII